MEDGCGMSEVQEGIRVELSSCQRWSSLALSSLWLYYTR